MTELVAQSSELSIRRALPPLADTDVALGIRARLQTVVRARPGAGAITDGHQTLTFAELAARACAVAEALWALADPADPTDAAEQVEPVAMLCGHDGPAVATALGVILSGHPLLVMDPQVPVARLRGFVEQLGARTCVTDAAHQQAAAEIVAASTEPAAGQAPGRPAGRVLLSPAESPSAAGSAWAASPVWQRPLDPAATAVLGFTSGSTGRPKVVALDHRQLVGDAWACATATDCISADDVMANTLPMAFAAGMNAALTGPLVGARMALYDPRAGGIAGLAAWIERVGVTTLHTSPAMLRALTAASPTPQQLRRLRSLTLGGEAAHGRQVAAARPLLPPTCTVFHRLGSTETGLVAEFRLGAGDPTPEGPLPAGVPLGHTHLALIDDQGRPVPQGQPGRLVVTRSHLAQGYWNDPEHTAEAFTDNPDGTRSFRSNDLGRIDEQGQLRLLGRRDHSVKVRGYLVEPGEVDAVLFAQPGIAEAVTVGLPRPDGLSNRLVAYVVSTAERPNAAAVRAGLRSRLPSHMVPETVVFRDALPRTDRGKIDRSALPPPPPPVGGTPPISEWESVIAMVWAQALELDEVPRDADFFELGGDSLAAEALIAAVTRDLGVPADGLSSALLVEAPTVAEFARRLRRSPDRRRTTLTTLNPTGTQPPLFLLAGGGGLGVTFVALARHLGADRPVYGLHAHALEHRGIPDWSVGAAARRHVATIRSIQPYGPYYLAGHSFGGVLAFEMGQQLRRAGERVGLLTILDSFPPDPELVPAGPPLSPLGRIKDAVGLAITGLVPTPGIGQYWRFHRQCQFLARRYHTAPYPGRTLVMVAGSAEQNARSQWGPHLSGSWQIQTIGGDHHSMLREPHAATLGAMLTSALAEAQDTAGRSLASS
jgi:acyl-coenzyme A synthetase/AMP-(fatty) acid ligase/thioesterase domain-containing protein